uniref:TGF-beta family profile domain-containing protein n=1 Tax=Gasterosteus aculeatus aculeatus TaxID=481459 RepID=A0AAQ4RW39_GASAC
MLWGLLALLPLVEGAHMKAGLAGVGSDSARAVGLLAGQEERGLPVTLPEVAKDEETGKGKSRQLTKSSRDCRVEKKEMKVRDLGLGFDSDEIVLFKFCVGSCQSSRTNYDLALKALLKNGSLPRRTARKVSSHPCCRPERYEPVSFMDAQTTWRTIQLLSAASCMCMG